MATDHYVVTTTPMDIIAANSLVVGSTYSCQYNGPSVLRIRESVAVPSAEDPALQVISRGNFTVIPQSGEGIYLWVIEGGGTVIIDEV